MNSDSSIIPYLFLVTLVIAMAIGVWQLFRARKARREGHRSVQAEVNHEPYSPAAGSGKRNE